MAADHDAWRAVGNRAARCPSARRGRRRCWPCCRPPPAPPRGEAAPLYKDPRAPVDLRVRDLLARMTLEEKIAQMITLSRTKRDVMDER